MEDTKRQAFVMRDAIITVAVVILALGAIDDITTDRDASFAFERAALVACAVWFVFLARRISQRGRRVLARTSLVAAVAFGLAQWAIRPDNQSVPVAYLVTLVGLVWFLMVAGILAWSSRPGAR